MARLDRIPPVAAESLEGTLARANATAQSVPVDQFELRLAPGDICGLLKLGTFVDPPRNIELDRGCMLVTFRFLDTDGVLWRYETVLTVDTLLPPPGTPVTLAAPTPFDTQLALKTLIDNRDTIIVPLTDGRTIRSAGKYNDTTCRLAVRAESVAIRLTIYSDRGREVGVEDQYITVDYELPIEHFLWRKAPVYSADDVMPLDADHVSCVQIGPMCDSALARGLIPGPVHATPRQT